MNNARPIMQRCTFCGQDWWDSHVCAPPKDMLAKLTQMLPPAPPAPLPQGLRISHNLTEADVRRIVREELAAEKEENRRKLRAFVAEVHGADPDSNPAGHTKETP